MKMEASGNNRLMNLKDKMKITIENSPETLQEKKSKNSEIEIENGNGPEPEVKPEVNNSGENKENNEPVNNGINNKTIDLTKQVNQRRKVKREN